MERYFAIVSETSNCRGKRHRGRGHRRRSRYFDCNNNCCDFRTRRKRVGNDECHRGNRDGDESHPTAGSICAAALQYYRRKHASAGRVDRRTRATRTSARSPSGNREAACWGRHGKRSSSFLYYGADSRSCRAPRRFRLPDTFPSHPPPLSLDSPCDTVVPLLHPKQLWKKPQGTKLSFLRDLFSSAYLRFKCRS